ncbi:MAG: hypothetical protein C5B59_18360 [Bacteroidetes bacterium]|nr:MAG: hypothetical protein C5B59_18360 [Bacteroidota bacterium]
MSKKDILWLTTSFGLAILSLVLYKRLQDKESELLSLKAKWDESNFQALNPVRYVSNHINAAKGSPVVHFELGCRDLSRLKDFYNNVFGWSASDITLGANFNTNSAEGIQGHLTSLGHEPYDYVTFYIQVEEIKATLAQIQAAGGKKIVGPIPLPDKRQFAWFSDPEGNMIGLVSSIP